MAPSTVGDVATVRLKIFVLLVFLVLTACSIDSRPYIAPVVVHGRKCWTVDVSPTNKIDYRVLCPIDTP
jgi:hypothetical protein